MKSYVNHLNRVIKDIMRTFASYDEAIVALNALQSNASVLEQLKKQRHEHPEENLVQVERFLKRSGLEVDDLLSLNAIHITGTKGKGSTCALAESILRKHGLKTGFYSSPHLVHVRERIRINGEPLSEEKFAHYFWLVNNRLRSNQTIDDPSMPAYFKFLTIMAFHVFLSEKVDVALIEVGIGGTYDCTNVIRSPVVCGISTLDFDHTKILGNTLEQIAWHKSGIMKPGSVAVCVDQPSDVLAVFSKRSSVLQCPLFIAPSIETYPLSTNGQLSLGIPGLHQNENASLAVQLCRIWLQRMKDKSYLPSSHSQKAVNDSETGLRLSLPVVDCFEILPIELDAFKTCKWPGRCQTIRIGRITYYLDGAHTPKSLECCSAWFKEAVGGDFATKNRVEMLKVLMFNCTSDRNPASLLPYLVDCDFDGAIFCAGMVDTTSSLSSELTKVTLSNSTAVAKCEDNKNAWFKLLSKRAELSPKNGFVKNTAGLETSRLGLNEIDNNNLTITSPCITSALNWMENLSAKNNVEIAVLVTGSLHLVGGVLSLIDPDLKL